MVPPRLTPGKLRGVKNATARMALLLRPRRRGRLGIAPKGTNLHDPPLTDQSTMQIISGSGPRAIAFVVGRISGGGKVPVGHLSASIRGGLLLATVVVFHYHTSPGVRILTKMRTSVPERIESGRPPSHRYLPGSRCPLREALHRFAPLTWKGLWGGS